MELGIGQIAPIGGTNVHCGLLSAFDLQMSFQKFGDRGDRPVCFRKLRKHLKDMDHAVPDLQFDIDADGARSVRKHRGIGQHRFAVADLNQQRRQPGEVGIQR